MEAQNEEACDFIDGVAAGGVVSGGVGRPGVGWTAKARRNWSCWPVLNRPTAVVTDLLETRYSDADKLMLVMDNLNTHSPASLYELLPPEEAKRLADRLEIHYTPKHGSWLNMAEIELSVVGERLPDGIEGIHALDRHCRALARERNQTGASVDWQFTVANARSKLKGLYPSIELR